MLTPFVRRGVQVDREFLDAAPYLKLVGSPTGTDHLDLKELKERGVTALDIAKEHNLPNQHCDPELAFSLILSLVRWLYQLVLAKDGIWPESTFGISALWQNLGILGLGRLGKITARIA